MGRNQRVFIENMTYHILLNSFNGMKVFKKDIDKEFFLETVEQYSKIYNIDIHTYLLDDDSFQFLATSKTIESIPKFMQTMGRLYVNYYNKKYDRTGTLWQGRYKSSLIDANSSLFDVMSFIERKSKTKYSSLDKNLYNAKDNIVVYHDIYMKLASNKEARIIKYKIFFELNNKEKDIFILDCLLKQKITGSDEFINKLEDKLGLPLQSKKRGRPRKNNNKGNLMYKKLVVLDKSKHNNIKITSLENLDFVKNKKFIPVLSDEMSLVGIDFPIVFSSDENPSIMAVISLSDENIAITENGKWSKVYLPTYFKKYPFSYVTLKDKPDQRAVALDIESELVNENSGQPLFDENLEETDFLRNAIHFLTQYEQLTMNTLGIAKQISDAKILEEREITVGEGENKKVLAKGFSVIDRELLNKLDDKILAQWVRDGIMNLIETHLKSLENFEKIMTSR